MLTRPSLPTLTARTRTKLFEGSISSWAGSPGNVGQHIAATGTRRYRGAVMSDDMPPNDATWPPTIVEYVNGKVDAVERASTARFESQEKAVVAALAAQEKAVSAALDSAQRAVAKAEYANEQKFQALEKTITAWLASQEKAVAAALDSAQRAVSKAEAANEKRFEGVNEFRSTLSDQARLLMPRSEAEQASRMTAEKIDLLTQRLNARDEQGRGAAQGWGSVVSIIAIVASVASVLVVVLKIAGN